MSVPAETVVADTESGGERGERPVRAALRVLLASTSGRLGVALFLVIVAVSLWVVATYPAGFGANLWSNPTVWANNPKTVPPAWTAWFGDGVEQQIFAATEPTSVEQRGAAEVRSYRFTVVAPGASSPTFLALTLPGINYHGRPPVVIATLVRPDGGEVRLASHQVSPPRSGEVAPYQRYYDSPERILLDEQAATQESVAQVYAALYPDLPGADRVTTNPAAALFGRPAADGSGRIAPLAGDYVVTVQVLVADPTDLVAGVDLIAGGTVFGIMGTDSLGRDLWRGLLYGFPVGLVIALVTSVLSTLIGTALGILSGYAGGITDLVIQRAVDIISNVPTLPLLIFIVFLFGSHLWLMLIVLVAFSWPGLTIVVRSMVLQVRSGQLVEAAQALGASRWRVMARHIFPQVAPFIVAQMIFSAPGAILAEASLSFLGLGDPTIPTWGQMLETGFRTGALYAGYWWWVIPPGLFLVFTAIVFMLVALGMEAVVDPRLRRQR